jgi:branched-chain amino acid transport system permease protein
MLIFGVVMVMMMMFRPGGIWPRKRGSTEMNYAVAGAGGENDR